MATFDAATAYQAKGNGTFFDDGRETALLHYLYKHPSLAQLRRNPPAVLTAIDDYARTRAYLMNIGSAKGAIVASTLDALDRAPRHPPQAHQNGAIPVAQHHGDQLIMLELGAYIGYSTVLFSSALRAAALARGLTPKYYSLERDPVFAAVVASVVDLAGLSDVVHVIVGPSDEGIKRLVAEGRLSAAENQIDVLFLDHYKPAYTTDLKLCEELGLIRAPEMDGTSVPQGSPDAHPRTGTVLCADNVVSPGNPPYLDYVRSSVAEKRGIASSALEEQKSTLDTSSLPGTNDHQPSTNGASAASAETPDARFNARTTDMYAHREGAARLGAPRVGDPSLVYASRLVESFEPTGERDGVEITWCVGRQESGKVRPVPVRK